MKSILRILNFVKSHPLTREKRLSALMRVIKWQVITKLYPHPFIYPYVEDSKLIVERGMTGATGNIYCGLHEFEDMGFLLHFLREGDIFGDIGANIGSYTVLASGVIKAKSVSVEPVPATFNSLKRNIKLNDLETLVNLHNKGAGALKGSLKFTKNLDTVNHVVDTNVEEKDSIIVQTETLDRLFASEFPILLKIDVEGFELNVLKGGLTVLASNQLQAIIIELNESGNRYGIEDEEVHNFLLSYNFLPYSYNPFERKLNSQGTLRGSGNSIYIKSKSFVQERLSKSRKFSVLGKEF